LGIKFEAAFEVAGGKALVNPDGGVPSNKGTRRRVVKGFPFSVVYRASDLELLVVAMAHHRREPACWSARMA
jgi:toxin ParE1/3/4